MLVPVFFYGFDGSKVVFKNLKRKDWESIELILENFYGGHNGTNAR